MKSQEQLSITEKKTEVLKKINEVIENFRKLQADLLEINTVSIQLKLASKEEERRKIIAEANEKLLKLLKGIDDLKKNNQHRTNQEIHEGHLKISQGLEHIIQGIISETKLKTIITVSLRLPELIQRLGKNIKTGIGLEIISESSNKFTKIQTPIDLKEIQEKIESQIENIENRITDAKNIYKVIKFLDIQETSPILNDLIDYILGGKSYDEIDNRLKEQGIIIEEIVAKEIDPFPEDIKTKPSSDSIISINETDLKTQETSSPPSRLKIFWQTLKEWLNTDKKVSWKQARENVLKKEVN